MFKQWSIQIGLLALVLALVAVAVYEPGLHTESAPPLLLSDFSEAARVRVERPGQPVLLLEKAQAHWYLREPLQLPANPFKIERLLNSLKSTSHAQLQATELNLAEFGLAPPQFTLTLDNSVFEFGTTSPLHGKRYVRVGEIVHVTDDVLYYQLEVPPASLAHLSPLGINARIQELQTPYFHLRRAQDAWLTEGADTALSSAQLQQTVDAWEQLQAFNVRPYAREDGENSQGDIFIRVHDQKSPLHFEIRALAPDLVLANAAAGVMYDISTRRLKELLQLADPTPE
jgi:hypothetical protein